MKRCNRTAARPPAVDEDALEIGTEGGMPDAPMFYAFQRLTLILDRCDPAARDELQMYCELAPPHYPGGSLSLAMMDIALGEPDRARPLLDAVASSPHAPWGATGGPHDAALTVAAWCAGAEAALGELSPWTGAAYDYIAPWSGQLFGNVMWRGPTESYLAAVAPIAGHPDALDALLETALAMCEEMRAPINDLYARIHGACALRVRNRMAIGTVPAASSTRPSISATCGCRKRVGACDESRRLPAAGRVVAEALCDRDQFACVDDLCRGDALARRPRPQGETLTALPCSRCQRR